MRRRRPDSRFFGNPVFRGFGRLPRFAKKNDPSPRGSEKLKGSIPVNGATLHRVFPFLQWRSLVNARTQWADLMAGITGAIIVLPQGIAFASIAGLPAEYGLYSAIAPAIVAALFGSSFHLVSGPTTAISIVIFAKVSTLAAPYSPDYIKMAFSITLLAGVFQLALGLVRMGALINFVSYSVLLGFTTGAAILIGASELGDFLGIPIPRGASFLHVMKHLFHLLPQANPYVVVVATATLVCAALLKRYRPRWPGLAMAMVFGSLLSLLLDGKAHDMTYVGSLPSHLPPFSLPDLSIDTLRKLAPGAMAVAMLGLAQAVSSARSVAALSHQRIDNNQEFIGQGLSNMIGSLFSSYATSGSFTRTGVNYDAGAKTPMSAVYAALCLTVMLFAIAPLTAYLPIASMAGVLMLVCYGLIDLHHIEAIWKTSKSEAVILAVTFLGTLFLDLEFALFTGVMLSLLLYLNRTSHPHFISVVPRYDAGNTCFVDVCDGDVHECPQLKMVRIDGSIFFGAVNHISEELHNVTKQNPEQCHILIIGSGINFIDVSGCAMLFQESRSMYLDGRQLYLCSLKEEVVGILKKGRCAKGIGKGNIFASKREALEKIIPRLDPERCRHCRLHLFQECGEKPEPEGTGQSRSPERVSQGESCSSERSRS